MMLRSESAKQQASMRSTAKSGSEPRPKRS